MGFRRKKIGNRSLKKLDNSVKIFGVALNSTSSDQLLVSLISRIALGAKTFVVTPNTEFLVFAQENQWFREILNSADVVIPDGVGLILASRFLGRPISQRIQGTDLMESLCSEASRRKWTVYLLGGRSGVAQKALESLQVKYPGLKGWADAGPRISNIEYRVPNIEFLIEKINQKKPDLLFVGLGMGKQEKFIYDNWKNLEVKLAMGVGGAFDYFSGEVSRAPVWLRKMGLEWFYRLLRQPWRAKRQLALVKFIWLVLKEKV